MFRLDRLSRSVLQTLQLVDDFKKTHNQLCITDIGNVHTDGVSRVFITILASLILGLPFPCLKPTPPMP